MVNRTSLIPFLLIAGLASLAVAQDEQPITASDREHWSFAPLKQPTIPSSSSPRALGPIDAFIAARLAKYQLDIAPAATPEHLLRRVTLDLTGLPPTEADRERFAGNSHLPDAYEREVDRLLASPACGEHLAQNWLDLARFAETDGFEHDLVRPGAWRYRDWLIAAINSDMPYDRFMCLQVAGDLMMEEAEGALATSFCLAGPDMPDLNDQDERRHNLLNEMTGSIGAALLGLQLGCAACHDHKYDPVSQADFYRLRGVLATGVPKLVRDKPWNQLREQDAASEVKFYHRGDHRQATVSLEPSVPRIASDAATTKLIATAAHPRLAFADWLCSADNPLPARVMANRLWQSHFGRGLSTTPSDLGLAGAEPTHPELLDWLAHSLREHSWSLQRMRRELILSATYRSRSFASGAAGENEHSDHARRLHADPDNSAYSRYPRRRLTGEMLRDAMLQVAGQLNRKAGGESVRPPLPDELLRTLLPNQWKASPDLADRARRSIYVFARRNLRYPIFESFDRPDAGAACPVRGQSVTATQALLMFNSEFSGQLSRLIAQRILSTQRVTGSGPSNRAEQLWCEVLGRTPTKKECKLLTALLEQFEEPEDGWTAAALGLLNSNEFVSFD